MRLCCRIVRRSTGYDNGLRAGIGVSCEPGLSITAKYGVAFLRICARRSSFPFPRTLAVCREVARDVSIVIHYDPLPCPCDSRSPQPLHDCLSWVMCGVHVNPGTLIRVILGRPCPIISPLGCFSLSDIRYTYASPV